MWTWQFELNDILTTLTIVGVVAGAGYRLLIIPLLQQLDSQRMQDNLIFQEKWGVLTDTLKDLKDEIKLSRAERIKAESKQVLLSAKVEALEVRVEDVAGDEAFLDPDLTPVVGGVGVLAQDADLFSRQRAVFFMKCGAHCLYIYKSTPQMYRLSYKHLPSIPQNTAL